MNMFSMLFNKKHGWNFPFVKMIKGEIKPTWTNFFQILIGFVLIKFVIGNGILYVFFPEYFPGPLTTFLISIPDWFMSFFASFFVPLPEPAFL